MYIVPNSNVKLLHNVPLDNKYRNTLVFSSSSAQSTYFGSKAKYSLTDYSYVREQRKLRVNTARDNLYDCNYIMFQNTSFGSKWFYAFVTNVEYINNNCTELTLELDVMQTWKFDYEIKPCFVEREHVAVDTVGLHIIDEGLALNDFVTVAQTEHIFNDWWICVGSTVDLKKVAGTYTDEGGYMYGGIYSGVSWYCFNTDTALWVLPAIMKDLAANMKSDAIVSMFMLPKDIVSTLQNDGGYLQPPRQPVGIVVPKLSTLDGYTPKNNKLLTYPYRSLVLSNNEGNAVTLRYEFFNNGEEEADIEFVGGIQPNSRIIAYPISYKGITRNVQEGVSLGNFPQCAWQKEVYAEWLAQQTIRWGYTEDRFMRNAITNILTSPIAGLASGNSVGAVTGAINGSVGQINGQLDMYSKMAEEKEVFSHVPNSVKGTIGNGYTNITMNKYGFLLECKTVRAEIAKSIDGYFDMYGYKVNSVKVPNIGTRPHWNYVKTINACVTGSIPANDLSLIANVLDRGVTFWKNGSEVGNYELDNSI